MAARDAETDDRALAEAAAQHGTPLYVIDARRVDRSAAELESDFGEPWVRQYSLKANDLPAVVAVLARRGWGANVVSAGEWRMATLAGVPNGRVSFEGVGKTDAELAFAVAACAEGRPLRWLSVESPEELATLAALAADAGLGTGDRPAVDVLVRINPAVHPETTPGLAVGSPDSKFGMSAGEATDLVREHTGGAPLRFRGVHLHVGSDLHDVGAWSDAGAAAVALLHRWARWAPDADTVDFGGGFPLSDGVSPTPRQFHRALLEKLDAAGLQLPPRPAIEPGRFLVGSAGWLVSSVLHSRARGGGRQVVLDAGMTELIRPALYGSRHPIRPVRVSGAAPQRRPGGAGGPAATSVEGPVCESTDTFGTHDLPVLRRGDLVAFGSVGAYGASFTSRYNGRPTPVEVMRGADGTVRRCERPAPTRPGEGSPPAGPPREGFSPAGLPAEMPAQTPAAMPADAGAAGNGDVRGSTQEISRREPA